MGLDAGVGSLIRISYAVIKFAVKISFKLVKWTVKTAYKGVKGIVNFVREKQYEKQQQGLETARKKQLEDEMILEYRYEDDIHYYDNHNLNEDEMNFEFDEALTRKLYENASYEELETALNAQSPDATKETILFMNMIEEKYPDKATWKQPKFNDVLKENMEKNNQRALPTLEKQDEKEAHYIDKMIQSGKVTRVSVENRIKSSMLNTIKSNGTYSEKSAVAKPLTNEVER
jgi:hypothetical protein